MRERDDAIPWMECSADAPLSQLPLKSIEEEIEKREGGGEDDGDDQMMREPVQQRRGDEPGHEIDPIDSRTSEQASTEGKEKHSEDHHEPPKVKEEEASPKEAAATPTESPAISNDAPLVLSPGLETTVPCLH